ncbi:MAG: DUF998 domain-containing protein [Mobilicoccus sp.]|nr:DUF998 domain-containing protein [Mobilicoccus sp.]
MIADRSTRWGALTWVLLLLPILVEIPVALAWDQPPYDPVHLTISDLGATTCTTIDYPEGPVAVCSPLHGLMNAATVLGGVLLGVGGVLLRRLAPSGWKRAAFPVLLVVSGLSWLAAALVPVDVDLALHVILALPAFLTYPVALLLVDRGPGPLLRVRRSARWVAVFCLVATLVTLLAPLAGLPLGLIERLALYPVLLWSIVVGAAVLREA